MPPCTTKRRKTTNLKTKNNQNCQKIKLWKSDNQGVKEETFIQTGRKGGDGQTGWSRLATRQWLVDQVRWWLTEWVVPHLHADKLGGTTRE